MNDTAKAPANKSKDGFTVVAENVFAKVSQQCDDLLTALQTFQGAKGSGEFDTVDLIVNSDGTTIAKFGDNGIETA